MSPVPFDWKTMRFRHHWVFLTPPQIAERNIASNREKLKAFESSAPPDLMLKLTACVDEYEDRVREFHGMEPRK